MAARVGLIVLCAICLPVAGATTQPGAADSWIEARSPHFHIVSNAGPERVRYLTEELETLHDLMNQTFLGAHANPGVPHLLILLKSREDLRAYAPLTTAGRPIDTDGLMQNGPDRMYLVVNAGAPDAVRHAFHEYTHLLVRQQFGFMPPWLDEGLAVYYQWAKLEGSRFTLGTHPPNQWNLMRHSAFIPFDVLLEAGLNSVYYKQAELRRRFYAESWLLVHYLIHAEQGRYKPRLEYFMRLLRDGVPQEEAFEQAFRTDYTGMQSRLERYRQEPAPAVVRRERSRSSERSSMEFAPLSSALAQVYLADLWLNDGRLEEARGLLREVTDSAAPPPEGLLRLGQIELERGRPLEAEEYFQAALALGPDDFNLRYYTARAISEGRGSGVPRSEGRLAAAQEVIELLTPVVAASGRFPQAQLLLTQAETIRRNEEWLRQVRKARAPLDESTP
jgi:tetratricopeptide (TPR) repeat protein